VGLVEDWGRGPKGFRKVYPVAIVKESSQRYAEMGPSGTEKKQKTKGWQPSTLEPITQTFSVDELRV
jgi:hypothetical protein